MKSAILSALIWWYTFPKVEVSAIIRNMAGSTASPPLYARTTKLDAHEAGARLDSSVLLNRVGRMCYTHYKNKGSLVKLLIKEQQ